ncbi:hypothetical protein C8Q80DRAFT_1173306 [Daedaleopsis nitida]|nr:hypothetical protein C8Q80DRAFT_1173306 [Daedaleopsis nitida]
MRLSTASVVPLVAAVSLGFGFVAAVDDHVILYPKADTVWYSTDQTHHVVWCAHVRPSRIHRPTIIGSRLLLRNPSKLPGTSVDATLQIIHPDCACQFPSGRN